MRYNLNLNTRTMQSKSQPSSAEGDSRERRKWSKDEQRLLHHVCSGDCPFSTSATQTQIPCLYWELCVPMTQITQCGGKRINQPLASKKTGHKEGDSHWVPRASGKLGPKWQSLRISAAAKSPFICWINESQNLGMNVLHSGSQWRACRWAIASWAS